MTAREVALKILYKIEEDGAYSNIALKDGLNKSVLDPRDSAFVTSLVYGVVLRKNSFDYVISKYSSVKLKKLSAYVLLILRMGIYQMFFMDKVPESAAVNESVKLANKYARKSSGFVNGVLRSVQRGGDIISSSDDIGIKYSFPKEICDLFVKQLGRDRAESVMDALNSSAEMTIRANSLKTTAKELQEKLTCESEVISDIPCALRVSGLDVSSSQLFSDGYYTVQGISAMLSVMALDVAPGQMVIDMCAAPGGKTTYIGELLAGEGKVIAFDIHEHKIELIKKNLDRLGIKNGDAKLFDGTVLNKDLVGTADRVLCDVPCSGLGIISKKPDIKWAFSESDLSDIQYKILSNAAGYLKTGGELVYSTCTINKKENEDVVNKFLENNSGYELSDFSELMPQRFKRDGFLTLYPDTDKTDGFFIAKIRRK